MKHFVLLALSLILTGLLWSAQPPMSCDDFLSTARRSIALFTPEKLVEAGARSEVQPEVLNLDNLLTPIIEVSAKGAEAGAITNIWTSNRTDIERQIDYADTIRADGKRLTFAFHRIQHTGTGNTRVVNRGSMDPILGRLTLTRTETTEEPGTPRSIRVIQDEYSRTGSGYLFYCSTDETQSSGKKTREYRLYFDSTITRGMVWSSIRPVFMYTNPPSDWDAFSARTDCDLRFYWRTDRGRFENRVTKRDFSW
jgi:hypothetical protein